MTDTINDILIMVKTKLTEANQKLDAHFPNSVGTLVRLRGCEIEYLLSLIRDEEART